MKHGMALIMLVGISTMMLPSLALGFAQNTSIDEQAMGSIGEIENLTSGNILANFSFIESIGNVTESLVNSTASTIGNISSNQTDM